MLTVLVVSASFGVSKITEKLQGPQDYDGKGSGTAVVQITKGSSGRDIAATLYDADIIKSADVFYQLTLSDNRALNIRPGFYKLRNKMSAKWALRFLVDEDKKVEGKILVREGARVEDIVEEITSNTNFDVDDVTEAFGDADALGLPAEAKGDPEGYLFPATYIVEPDMTVKQLLHEMVQKTLQMEKKLDMETRAKAVGLTKEQVLVMASILEYEANRDEDYPKVARVLFNRLKQDMALQLDSTVTYISKRKGDVWTTDAERSDPSAYNTYKHAGLPPGPIGSPGKQTIEAVLHPAKGDWLYFVPDFKNKTTIFSKTLAEHEKAVEKAKEYCRSHDDC